MGMLGLLGRIAGHLLKFLWRVGPVVLRLMYAALVMVLLNLQAIYRDYPTKAKELSNIWVREAVLAGYGRFDRKLYRVFYWVALVTLFFGWIVLAYLTVWIIGVIF